jgi:choline dehydrogenase-like flavoprotein
MLIDALAVPPGDTVRGDVCIVGAGAAGIAIARVLRDARPAGRPLRIVLLESGSLELHRATQALYRGRNVGREYFPLDGCRVRTFGGSTQRWGGWCRSLDEDDFAERDWIAGSGWPIGAGDLAPYYPEARRLCQLVVTEGEIDHGPPLPRRPRLSVSDPALRTIVYQFSPPTRFGQAYQRDLASSENTHVYLSANVVKLDGGAHGGPVTAAVVRTLKGTVFRVEARRFILAAGGIENPRLLLASHDVRSAGLGNEQDLVGRYFMEHLHVRLGCFVPTDPRTNLSFYIEGRRSVRRPLGAFTLSPAARRAGRLAGFSAVLLPPSRRSVDATLRRQARLRDPWGLHAASIAQAGGVGFALRVVDKFAREVLDPGSLSLSGLPLGPGRYAYEIMGRGEQTPWRESRVMIDRDPDRLGMPSVVLDWRVNPSDLQSMTASLMALGAVLARSGVGTLHLPDDSTGAWAARITGSWHHIGTTRMHRDPRHGVVDANSRVHSVPNLYVTGSSVFPTGGYANPTLTILAVALRLADHVAQCFARESTIPSHDRKDLPARPSVSAR